MISEALAQIDLERYHQVACGLLPDKLGLALVGEGEVVVTAGTQAPATQGLLRSLDADHGGWAEGDRPQHFCIGGQHVAIFAFVGHSGSVVAHLLACYPQTTQAVEQILEPLIACMQTELKLADELMVMADELTARYEELNLVYDTQDQASDYEDTQNQLKMLVDNCRDYLNVAFSGLVLRDKKIAHYDMTPDLRNGDVHDALSVLKGPLFDWISATKQVAVINDVTDKLGAVLCPGLPYRVVAAPVLTGTSDVIGVLVIARSYAQPSFTNNDKNLLDVMSRKASKILQASYDTHTGLIKRSGFEYEVNRALQLTRVSDLSSAILVIDIDHMQAINDGLSYEAGDLAIRKITESIKGCLREANTLARLGGDEFGVLLLDCDVDTARIIAVRISETVERLQLDWKGQNIEAHVSIGVAPVTSDAPDVSVVIATAEVACSSVKDRGGNGVSVYQSGNEALVRRRSYMDLVRRIQDTLRSDRFELHCQPIVPLQAGDTRVHGEVLVRMRGESGELISPKLFLPAAERYHLMPAVDRWIVAKTIDMLQASDVFSLHPNILISINLSGQTLSDEAFVQFIDVLFERSSIPPSNICFEITETTAIGDIDQAKRFIQAVKERGVPFSLDDFGSGLSTFAYLKELPVDFVKIDGSFVKDICEDPVAETMVSAINKVAQTMKLKTVGEFVENDAIRQRLADMGVDYGQGYGIAKPMLLEDYLAGLSGGRMRNAG